MGTSGFVYDGISWNQIFERVCRKQRTHALGRVGDIGSMMKFQLIGILLIELA